MLLAFGGALAGYVLYVKDGRLTYEYVFSGHQKYVVHADRPLTPGRHVLRYEFTDAPDDGGRGALFIDGIAVGSIAIPKTWPLRAVQAGLTCGRDTGLPVSDAYECPFAFTGTIHCVDVELGEERKADGRAGWPSGRRPSRADWRPNPSLEFSIILDIIPAIWISMNGSPRASVSSAPMAGSPWKRWRKAQASAAR